MRNRSPSFLLSGGWPPRRRIAAVAAVAVLLAVSAAVALLAGGSDSGRVSAGAASAESGAPSLSGAAPVPSSGTGSVPAPGKISDPVAYARAAARMLWTYDTRDTSRDQQLAGMRAWMTTEPRYADWASVAGQVPDPVLWSRMADQDQHAAADAAEGHYPSAFKQALADDPSAITEAYIYAVTVNGTQHIAWDKGGSGAEDRSVTLAVQCRPGHDCALAAIAPNVTQ